MVNQSLQELDIAANHSISDDGISAIARAFGECKINTIHAQKCGITLTGAKALAEGLSSNHTIKDLTLYDNTITTKGARMILNSAVQNTICQGVIVNLHYQKKDIQRMMKILEGRKRRQVATAKVIIASCCDLKQCLMVTGEPL